MNQDVYVAGVGMIPFSKPGASASYHEMGGEAARLALEDARLQYDDIEHAVVGYVYGETASGQAALYRVGMTSIPVINVNNACATGSTALFAARQLVACGAVECAIAVGFEQMRPGALVAVWHDRPSAFQRFEDVSGKLLPEDAGEVPFAIRYFGGAGKEYMDRYGTTPRLFAEVRAKASRHAVNNPLALLRKPLSAEEVLASPTVFPGTGLTRLMACPPTCGAAAAILVSEAFARRRGLDRRVRIAAQSMTTDRPSSFDSQSMIRLIGYDMTRAAAEAVYKASGVGPEDLDVVELHDCFAQNEVLSYEALRLCPEGGTEKFVADADNTYGGKMVINPSGGLLSKGHPLGATGLAQCTELVQQLRGNAGARQVENARNALQHNLGLGGACVVTLYQRVA